LDPKTRLLCKQKIAQLESKIEEIERLKAEEPKLRRELQAQREKLAQCPEDDEAEQELLAEEEAKQAQSDGGGVDVQKRLKALNKKLKQIADLKAKGGALDPEAAAKVASEGTLLREVAALKAGKVFTEEADAEIQMEEAAKEPAKVELPSDPAEREKRLKTLNKKLQQISDLKKKDEALDNEARAKVSSERHVKQEIQALERGDAEVVFTGPTEDEIIEEAVSKKIDVERKLKAVRKKLAQIDSLKSKEGALDADAQAKVASEAGLKKELGAIERELGALNRAERERVARRLGYADDQKPGKSKK